MSLENKYYYQDGTEVKQNDIVFYSEDTGEHNFHYADSIGLIVKRGNDLKMKAYVITMDEAETFEYYEEPETNMVSLKYGCENYNPFKSENSNKLINFTKIGEWPKDKSMLSSEHAQKNFGQIKTR